MDRQNSNFVFPYKALSNDRISVIPWDVTKHSELLVKHTNEHTELFAYFPWGPFPTVEAFDAWYNGRVASNPAELFFAVLNKSVAGEEGEFAGMVGLIEANEKNASVEIDCITLPRFQRTHVTTNSVGLLLQYCLDPPPTGLGLRRVQWQANTLNKASMRTAEKLGFTLEGIIRWQRVLDEGRVGNKVDVSHLPEMNGKKLGPGRHTAMYSFCWDDWVEKRAALIERMARVS